MDKFSLVCRVLCLSALAITLSLNGCNSSETGSGGSTGERGLAAHGPSDLAYSMNPAVYTRGVAITPNTTSNSGTRITQYSIVASSVIGSVALPAGLSFDPNTGQISGTPTAVTPQTTYFIQGVATDGSDTVELTLMVNDAAPQTLSYADPNATYTRGVAIIPNLARFTGGTPTSFRIDAPVGGAVPTLPAGLNLDGGNGSIYGTPSAVTGRTVYTISATNSSGASISTLVAITVANPTPTPSPTPTSSPTAAPTATPTPRPTNVPTSSPSSSASPSPTAAPTATPTPTPTPKPTIAPTASPSSSTSPSPTAAPTATPTPAASASPAASPTPNYATVAATVFTPRCVSCHGSSGGVSLSTYASVKANLTRVNQRALIDKTMPPSGPLSTAEQNLLKTWIQAGAPQ